MTTSIDMLDFDRIEAAFEELGYGLVADPSSPYIGPTGPDVSYDTKETLADWKVSSRQWAERGRFDSGEVNGMAYIRWERAQARPGQRRRDVVVIEVAAGILAIYGMDK